MKLSLEDFWDKQVGVTWGSHFIHGILSKNKSNSSYITLLNVPQYQEYRISHEAIDSIGIFIDESKVNGS